MYVLINSQTKIVEADGKEWVSRIPGVSFFVPGEWFNIVALMEEQGIRYYCNIASPPYVNGRVITYIDYDLDVIRLPAGDIHVVDQEEYERHKQMYHYSAIVDTKVKQGLHDLLARVRGASRLFKTIWSTCITRNGWNGDRRGRMRLFPTKKVDVLMSDESAETHSGQGWPREMWEWFKMMAVALILVVLVHQYLFHVSAVRGNSMQPTLEEGEWLFINKTLRYAGSLQRGDIVVLREPADAEEGPTYLVKRVVAVAGDEVHIRRGKLYVNGKEADEPYTETSIQDGRFEPLTVADGYVFVMGDNRRRYASNDSRSFGAVPLSLVEGRAEWIVWPIRQWRNL